MNSNNEKAPIEVEGDEGTKEENREANSLDVNNNKFELVMIPFQEISPQGTKARALAMLGVDVFPCRHKPETIRDKVYKEKTPLLPNGFKGATRDLNIIDEWWTKWPDALVGYWTGSSGLFVIDLDNKKGKCGEHELDSRELDYYSPVTYKTPNGGIHAVFKDDPKHPAKPATDYKGLLGVDIRGGDSYAIFYGEVPETLEGIPSRPEWTNGSSRSRKTTSTTSSIDSVRYQGDLSVWLEWLGDDEPWWNAQAILYDISISNHIGHDDLIKFVWRIHWSRIDGDRSMRHVFKKLVEKFQMTTNNDDWMQELEDSVRGALGKTWGEGIPEDIGLTSLTEALKAVENDN